MRHWQIIPVALASTLLAATPAKAASVFTSLSSWQAAVGSYQQDTAYGSNFSSINTLALNGGAALNFSSPVSVRTIGSGWATWSGGYTGQVLATSGSSLSFTLNPLGGLGFFVEPDTFSFYNFTLGLSDGSSTSASYTGSSGAGFLGFAGSGITSVTVTTTDSSFALGNFFVAPSSAVPEPATWAMMLTGFGVMGVAMRRRQRVSVRFA